MPIHKDSKAVITLCVIATIATLSYYFWRLKRSKKACDGQGILVKTLDEEFEEKETMGDRRKLDPIKSRRKDDGDVPSNNCIGEDEDDQSSDTKIFVSNIGYQVRTGELKDFFSYFGHVTQVNLLRDRNRKRSRGLAFITFRKRTEAERAKAASDYELTLDGRLMKCSDVQRKSRRSQKDKSEVASSHEFKVDVMPQTVKEEPPSIGDGYEGKVFEDDSLVNALPDDVLIKIFSYLTMQERIAIESVCKRWRKVCEATWLSQSSLHFTNMFKGFSFSEEQVGPTVMTDAILKSILFKGCYNLKHLDISASPRFLSVRSLNCIGQVCRELKSLNLSFSKVDNNSIKTITNGSRNIERIILKGCQELGEKGVWWLFHNCENLYHVDLTENRRVNGKCFHILNKHCKVVLLNGCCSVNDKGLDCLTAKCGENLQELDISGCMIISDKGFINLTARCKSLQNLKMCGVHSKVTSAGLKTLSNLTSLDTLHLTYHQEMSDAILAELAYHCTRLRELRIDGCNFQEITDVGMRSLAHCPCLEVLNISYLGKVTDEGFKHLALAGRLQTLVARSLHITDEAIGHLAAHCLRLRELDVCGCTALTINSVQVFLEARDTMTEAISPLTLDYGGTSITRESLAELGDIDKSVTVCLQNFNAPPGQRFPTLTYDERLADSSDSSEEDEDFEVDVDPLDDERPILNLAVHLNLPRTRQTRNNIEYLEVPAESDEPWDGIVQSEPAECQGSDPVVGDPEQFREVGQETSGEVPLVPGKDGTNGAGNFHVSQAHPEVHMGECLNDSHGFLNHGPATELTGPAGPGHFAYANPDLAQFVDVEEHLLAGDHGRGGDWSIAEEDVDDFLDADDPAYMNDMLLS
ncbi:uncharacterized protein LOC129254741 [Lytechinus pictus]|uniref:uncharacterized protein LOC129254741 n=1 Tax=Lytechinus pictus TaxID=7653 RepID=UPI0030B9EE7B